MPGEHPHNRLRDRPAKPRRTVRPEAECKEGSEDEGGLNALVDALIFVLIFATLAAAWSWLGSYAGIVSLGHAVFFGIGSYAVAVSNFRGGSPWYGALGGALLAVAVAMVCALVCLRGRGYAFALVTLLLGALAEPFAAARNWLGPRDAFTFPFHPGFLSLQFEKKWPYLLLALAVFAVAQGLTFALRSTRIGYSLRALRASPATAASVGVAALPPRLAALAVSAFVTSVAGSLFAQYTLAVSPHAVFGLSLSFDIALLGVVAGSASPFGPLFAGLVYELVMKVVTLHPPGPAGAVVLIAEGMLVVLVVLLRPQGLFALPQWRKPVRTAKAAR
jgi:branched-chain amino acid transport system permease protein